MEVKANRNEPVTKGFSVIEVSPVFTVELGMLSQKRDRKTFVSKCYEVVSTLKTCKAKHGMN